MSVIRIKKRSTPYVTLNTTALNDACLSFRAKGLHTYLMSKPDNWKVYIAHLEHESPKEGRDAIRSALKELEEAGYITRTRIQDSRGRMMGWDTKIYETADLAKEDSENTENGLTYIGSTEIGLSEVGSTEVGSTEVGLSATTYSGIKEDLIVTNLDGSTPPLTPQGEGVVVEEQAKTRLYDPMAASYDQTGLEQAREVLRYLNQVTGMEYQHVDFIKERMGAGATVDDGKLVIDWWDKVWTVNRPNQRDLFDYATPFKQDKFDKYRAAAQRWHKQHRPDPKGAASATNRLSTKGQSNVSASKRIMEDLMHEPAGHSPLLPSAERHG